MPSNNQLLPRKKKEEWDGTTYMPLARVKKIIKLDDEIDACTPAAAFLISIAAEEFIWDLSTAAHKMTKVEKKPRKNIQYKDLANAVSRMDQFEFLSDIIPKTVPFSQLMEKKKAEEKQQASLNFGGAAGEEEKKKGKGGRKKKVVEDKPAEEVEEEVVEDEAEEDGDASPPEKTRDLGVQDDSSDGSPVATETTRMKDMHISKQAGGSGAKRGKRAHQDTDGDMVMN